MPQKRTAVVEIRGVRRSIPSPGDSASMSPRPLDRSDGSTITTRTTMPMPPAHWVSWRYMRIPDPWDSMGLCAPNTVEPVHEKPETDSNRASASTTAHGRPATAKVPASRYGRAPSSDAATQVVPTALKMAAASRAPGVATWNSTAPTTAVTAVAAANATASVPSTAATRVATAIPRATKSRAMPATLAVVDVQRSPYGRRCSGFTGRPSVAGRP